MPWDTPTLATVRQNNRDYITAQLGQPLIPNDVPRVLADANAGNAHLNLQYLDWLALQLLPDTAEQQFLDKWATLFLKNADGSLGRKAATYASGSISVVATVSGTTLPAGSTLTALSGSTTLSFQTTAATPIGTTATSVPVRALVAGSASNLTAGSGLSLSAAVPGISSSSAMVVALAGGTDQESDTALRARVLFRLQQPPMGGDASDYVAWALACSGVTRAWASPNEMGAGTMTLRFMMDELRATSNPMTTGLPNSGDIAQVAAYLNSVRPVTVAELYVCAPTPTPTSFTITNLTKDTTSTRAAIAASVASMLMSKGRPASARNGQSVGPQTIFAAWVSSAIAAAAGVCSFDLTMADLAMPNKGSMAVLGSIYYA